MQTGALPVGPVERLRDDGSARITRPDEPDGRVRPATGPRSPGTSVNGGPAFAEALALWTRVEETRVLLADLRCSKPNTLQDARARVDCLEALQAYADCLVAQRRPVPYALRDDLRLMQLTCGSTPQW